jgi:hypothetical protein
MSIDFSRLTAVFVLGAALSTGCGPSAALDASSDVKTPGPSILTPNHVVGRYLEATTWQERLPYVFDPERVRPLLAARFGEGTALVPPKSFSAGPPEGHGAYVSVGVIGTEADGTAFQSVFPLRKTDAGWKIDWEAAVGYNPKPLKTFLANKPPEPATFRVLCDLATYYNFNYVHAQHTHLSVRIVETDPFKTTHGYVSRDSEVAHRLVQLLEDGKAHPLTLELKCEGPEGEPVTRPGANAVAIKQIISESWVLGDEPPPTQPPPAP